MSIIFKFILKNIKEKKFRTFLIIISITASAALFFASVGLSNTFKHVYTDEIKSAYGSADLMIMPDEKSMAKSFVFVKPPLMKGKVDYYVPSFDAAAQYRYNKDETINMSLYGYNLDDLMNMNPVIFDSKFYLQPFTGKKIIISKQTADKYKLTAGSRIKLYIRNANYNFTVAGVALNEGIFKNEMKDVFGIVPLDTINSLYDSKGEATMVYVKVSAGADKVEVKNELSKLLHGKQVTETMDQSDLTKELSQTSNIFTMMLMVVLLMSTFIIYTVFKIITVERLPIIGTFRSIGATKHMTNWVLFAESCVYGIIGGIIGDIIGIGLLKLMVRISTTPGVKITAYYNFFELLAAFFMAIAVSVISSIIPIIRTSRIPVKEIVLNNIENKKSTKLYRLILGISLLLYSLAVSNIKDTQYAVLIYGTGLASGIIAMILLVPYITNLVTVLLQGIYSFIFGNEGVLAAKNLKNNKSITNNICLLTIGISVMFAISTISFSFGKELISAYDLYKFDIFFSVPNMNDQTKQIVQTVDGVTGVDGVYATWNVKIGDTDKSLIELDGINKNKLMDYLNVNMEGKSEDVLNGFDDGRNIIITKFMQHSLNVQKGDTITLKLNNARRDYKVVGFYDSEMQDGKLAFIPERYYKLDTGDRSYNYLGIQTTSDIDKVKNLLKKQFKNNQPNVVEVREYKKMNEQSMHQLMLILNLFSGMAVCLGIFGVLNNFIIGFIERQRALAVLSSVGMSKFQRIKMIFVESLTMGMIGGIIGASTGVLICNIIPKLLNAMDTPLGVYFSSSLFIESIIAGIIVAVIASILPAVKSSKLNVVEAIKYE